MQVVLTPPSYHPSDQSSTGLQVFTDKSTTRWAALSHLNPSGIKSVYVIGAMPYCPSALWHCHINVQEGRYAV